MRRNAKATWSHGELISPLPRDLDWNEALTIEDTRRKYSKPRFLSYATIADRLYAMVWTPRGDVCRVISLRKANIREVLKYDRET